MNDIGGRMESIVKHPMSNKMGLEIFNYMMETSGRILELSEISRNSDIGVADELNLIASNMAHHANTILHEYCDHGIIETIANNLKVYNGETKKFSVKSYEAQHPEMVRYLTDIGINDQVLNDAKKDYDIIVFLCRRCAEGLGKHTPYIYTNGEPIPRNRIKVIITDSHEECEKNELNFGSLKRGTIQRYSPISLYDKYFD